MSAPPKLPRAPAARTRLEAAQSALSTLVLERDALALDALEGRAGADKALASHRAKIAAAEINISELAGALKLAERLDREADAAAAAQMRAEQLAVFEKASAVRVDAMAEVLTLIGKAAEAYGRYVQASSDMATSLPTGVHLPVMHFEGFSGHFLGNGEALIGREAFRVAIPGARPPFARLPALSADDDVAKMRPGAEILRDAHAAVLESVKAQVERLDAAAIERASRTEQVAA